jgi:hypothetical protein
LLIISGTILLSSFCPCSGFHRHEVPAQASKEQGFQRAVQEVIALLTKRDSAGLSVYIDRSSGVYEIYLIGAMDQLINRKGLSFRTDAHPFFHLSGTFSPLKYQKLPIFDCDSSRWSQKGTYVDTLSIDHKLSELAKFRSKWKEEVISDETIANMVALEGNSRRVIASKEGEGIIFYLTYLRGKWYLTIIDRATTDCSA